MIRARDHFGRDVSLMARNYAVMVPRFLGADPTEVAYLMSHGLSATDANFISDYAAVDKTALNALLQSGQGGYAALSTIYGGTYTPNVDAAVQASSGMSPADYAAQQAAIQNYKNTTASGGATPPPTTGTAITTPPPVTVAPPGTTTAPQTGQVPPPLATVAGIQIPSTIFGLPTILVAAAAGVGLFMASRQ